YDVVFRPSPAPAAPALSTLSLHDALPISAIAGGTVARTGLRPVARLTEAAERVARTDDLRPIPVHGNDELARLTEAFNMMLRARSEEHTSELQSRSDLVCRLLLEKKKHHH